MFRPGLLEERFYLQNVAEMDGECSQIISRDGAVHNAESSERGCVCLSSVGLNLMIITDPALLPGACFHPLKPHNPVGNQGSSRAALPALISTVLR